jgi:hypothetical protein
VSQIRKSLPSDTEVEVKAEDIEETYDVESKSVKHSDRERKVSCIGSE